ncbi:MAG: YbgC/FadM family acyl-CoA thioesterase [Burkholderiaceae bacterium]|nr:YbgC/FadM family acyl-CoA thioesterase [Rhodoferax sp.]MCP5285486.1 YbgC/FadM family acyl-CoA thioesterase [Burkholderiaceae bacterium]
MNRSDFRFAERLRVRWVEVDLQKIVFNGHYLMYFDTAVAGWWRAMALPYEATMHDLGGDFFVRKASVEYEDSARYDDQLEVGMRCERIGNSSMLLRGGVFRDGRLLVGGELVYVYADPATKRSMPVPGPLRDLFLGYEAGESVLDVQVGTWDTLGRQAQPIRQAVFVDEQGIPADLEYDAADATAVHAVAVNRLGRAVATGRLLEYTPGVSKIGRMAVIRALRGGGAGATVLQALVDAARTRGDREVLLHAQASAVGFYLRRGFRPVGDAFEEAGIPHQAMAITL